LTLRKVLGIIRGVQNVGTGRSIYTCSALPDQATAPTLLSRATTITVFVDLVNIILDLRAEILE
jgi:hypothetical protein